MSEPKQETNLMTRALPHHLWLVLFPMLAMLSGCFSTIGLFDGQCEDRSDCPDWAVCRDGACFKDPLVSLCEPATDTCGVGATCVTDVERDVSYCEARPLRIGYVASLTPELYETRRDAVRILQIVLEHVSEKYLTQPFEQLGWGIEFYRAAYPQGDTAARIKAIKEMIRSDVDIILSGTDETYKLVENAREEEALYNRFLHLGTSNRLAEVFFREQETPPPPLEERYDFSYYPFPWVESSTMAYHAKNVMGCHTLVTLYPVTDDLERVYAKTIEAGSKTHGVCHEEFVLETLDPEYDFQNIDGLLEYDREGVCIHWPFTYNEEEIAFFERFARATDAREGFKWKVIFRGLIASYINLETSTEQQQLFLRMLENGGSLYKFSLGETSTAVIENGLFVENVYTQAYEKHCADASACLLPEPELVRAVEDFYIDSTDRLMLVALAAYGARVVHGTSFSEEDLRASFVSMLGKDESHADCTVVAADACFDRLLRKLPVHYQGLFSPMYFEQDGRAEVMYGDMTFDGALIEEGRLKADPEKRHIYPTARMLELHSTPLADPPMECP